MRLAMTGVRRAYQCAPTAPNGLHFNTVFTAAAREAQLEHVVTLGQWLSAVDHPSLFTREVYLSDLLIRMNSSMTVTSVNPGWFADNYLNGSRHRRSSWSVHDAPGARKRKEKRATIERGHCQRGCCVSDRP